MPRPRSEERRTGSCSRLLRRDMLTPGFGSCKPLSNKVRPEDESSQITRYTLIYVMKTSRYVEVPPDLQRIDVSTYSAARYTDR